MVETIMQEIINDYWVGFKNGKEYNYYLDKMRYNSNDTWATKADWVKVAKECISSNHNVLQALEILIIEEYDEYYLMVDEILTQWYANGGYDIEYYYDLIIAMPNDYPIKKEIIGDYSDYFKHYNTRENKLIRESFIRNQDVGFCKIYGSYLDDKIKNNKNNFKELALMIDAGYIFDLGTQAVKYIKKDNLNIVKKMLIDYIQKDKELALKILDGYVPNIEEEQTLWIIDYAPRVASYLGWYDILEYLSDQKWYWNLLFDVNYGYEDSNNTNLLIWSNHVCNDTLRQRAYTLVESTSRNKLDGVISLTRMWSVS
jgi:hypothetical protein